MGILRWYRYLFYRVYLWRCSRPNTPISQPEFDAAWFIAIVNSLYLLAIAAIAVSFSPELKHDVFDENFTNTKLGVAIVGTISILLHGYLYVWNGSSKKIIKEFSNVRPTRSGTFAVIFYLIFSYVFMITSGILFYAMNLN